MQKTADEIRAWLATRIAKATATTVQNIDPHEQLASLGIDSVTAVNLTADLEEWLDRAVPETFFLDNSTIEDAVRFLAGAPRNPER